MKITGVSGIRDYGEFITIELNSGDLVHLDRDPKRRHSIVMSSHDTLLVEFNKLDIVES